MKTINRLLVLSFIVTIILSCGGNELQNKAAVEVAAENLVISDYAIEGMVCAMGCAATIEKEIIGMAGVVMSDVDYEAGKAHIEFDKSIVSENDIIAKIEGLGDGQYKVGEWSTESNDTEIEIEVEVEDESNTNNEKTITEVSLPSFQVPNLFTLLMDQI